MDKTYTFTRVHNLIDTWIVAVEMFQKMRPQEFPMPDTEGRGGETKKSNVGSIFQKRGSL